MQSAKSESRLRSLLIALVAISALAAVNPQPAAAFGEHDRHYRPYGWGATRDVHHWAYYPRYRHVYHVDPYAYRYSPRGYYPWYGSNYWVSSRVARQRKHAHTHHWNASPPRFVYYPSWSYPRHWHHSEWHARQHGYHHDRHR